MKQPLVITVGREYGSGGRQIAQLVAKELAIPCYDKGIMDEAAKELKLSPDVVEKHDERPVSYWDTPGYQYYSMYCDDPSLLMPVGMRVANAQFALIRKYAAQGSCVIVGRCADFALEGRENVLNVFIYAPQELRAEHTSQLYKISKTQALRLVRKTDKIRAAYYKNYTHRPWGANRSYELQLDSSKLGIEGTAQAILRYAKTYLEPLPE